MIISTKTPKGNKATLEYTYDLPMFRDAKTIGSHVKILPTKKDDVGDLIHELTHVDQWYKYRFYSFRYKYFAGFRKRMEAEAYAAQLIAEADENKINEFSLLLSQKYKLGISQKDAAIEILNAAKRTVK